MGTINSLVKIRDSKLLDTSLFEELAVSMRIIRPLLEAALENTPISDGARDFLRSYAIVDSSFLDRDTSLKTPLDNGSERTGSSTGRLYRDNATSTGSDHLNSGQDDGSGGADDDEIYSRNDDNATENEELDVNDGITLFDGPHSTIQDATPKRKSKGKAVEKTETTKREARVRQIIGTYNEYNSVLTVSSKCEQCQHRGLDTCLSRSSVTGRNSVACGNCKRVKIRCSHSNMIRRRQEGTPGSPKSTESKLVWAGEQESGDPIVVQTGHTPDQLECKAEPETLISQVESRPPRRPIEATEDSEMSSPPHKKARFASEMPPSLTPALPGPSLGARGTARGSITLPPVASSSAQPFLKTSESDAPPSSTPTAALPSSSTSTGCPSKQP